MTWEHKEVAISIFATPRGPGDSVEVYQRSWRERLLSWPWRPWVATGTRKTAWALMMDAHRQAREDLEKITGVGISK